MRDLNQLLTSSQANQIMSHTSTEQIKNTPEAQKLLSMLNKATGNIDQAAEDAAQGNSAQLMSAIKQLMKNPEATQLMQKMAEKIKL